MKKKIALLLAFSMILSILPMNAFASWNNVGRTTGILADQAGPATNVRHWDEGEWEGALVGLTNGASAVSTAASKNYNALALNNLRYLFTSLEYFVGNETLIGVSAASIRVQLENAERWLRTMPGYADPGNTPSGGTTTGNTVWPRTSSIGSGTTLSTLIAGGDERVNPVTPVVDTRTLTNDSILVQIQDYLFSISGPTIIGTSLTPGTAGYNLRWELDAALGTEVLYSANDRKIFASASPMPVGGGSFVTLFVPYANRLAMLVMFTVGHTAGSFTPSSWSTNLPFNRIPMEYVTNGDTNDGAFVTLHTFGNWPFAGTIRQANNVGRTDLTTSQDRRFHVQLDDTVRAFQRYGRVTIDPVRIREASQGAFDEREFIVDLEITTPGFFWTQENEDLTISASATNREGTAVHWRYREDTSAGVSNNNIGPVRYLDGGRPQRVDSNRTNQNAILRFGLDLQGADRANRMVNDWLQFQNLVIGANDRAREGDVSIDVVIYRADGTGGNGNNNNNTSTTWRWVYVPYWNGTAWTTTLSTTGSANFTAADRANGRVEETNGGYWEYRLTTTSGTNNINFAGRRGEELDRRSLVVARYGQVGLDIFRHADDDLADFELRSGMNEWTGGSNFISGAPTDYHGTARVVLKEVVPGSLPATGAHPTTYTFPEGIIVLGANFSTNDEVLIREQRDQSDQEVWYSNQREADNFMSTSIARNTVTIRPEIGREEVRRSTMVEITADFLISVQPGYEHLYGPDVDVVVSTGTVNAPIEETVTVARVWDPITVDTNPIVLDSANVEAAFGLVRNTPINDIVVTEVEASTFFPGTRVWVGVEGGISRGWGAADAISLGATSAHVEGDSQMQISAPRLDSHGVYVEVTRASRENGARIVFTGVEISGRVIPGNSYNIVVAGDAIAANWNGLAWINSIQNSNLTAGVANYGFFTEDPYPTAAFSFEGSELYAPGTAPGSGSNNNNVGGGSSGFGTGAVVLSDGMNYPTKTGEVLLAPVFRFVPNAQNSSFVTSYVMVRVVADILDLTFDWNEATRTATFTGRGTTVALTHQSSFAVVNGQQVAITASGLPADARIIDGRFFVPIKFFEEVFPGVSVDWNPTTRTVTVTP